MGKKIILQIMGYILFWWHTQSLRVRLVIITGGLAFIGILGSLVFLGPEWVVIREREAKAQKATLMAVIQLSPDHWNEARRDIPAPDLSGIQLSAVEYSGLDLSYVDFSNAKMSGVTFRDCDLSHTDLSGASFRDVYFERVKLNSVLTMVTDFHRTTFLDSDIVNAHFDLAEFDDVLFNRVNLRNAVFGSIRIKNVSIVASDLTEATLGQPILVEGLTIRDSGMRGFGYRAFASNVSISIINSKPCPGPLREYCR